MLIGGATLWSVHRAREEGRQQVGAAENDIQRLLTPLDDISIAIDFKLNCDNGSFAGFCFSIVTNALTFRKSYIEDPDIVANGGAVEASGVRWTASPSKDRSAAANLHPGRIKPGEIGDVLKALGTFTPTGVIVHSSSTWWSAWPNWAIEQRVILPIDISIYARELSGPSDIESATPPALHGYLVGSTPKSDTALEAHYDFESQKVTIRMRGHLRDLTRDRRMVSTEDLHGATMVMFETNQNFFDDAEIVSFSIETKGGVRTVVDVARLVLGPKRQSRSYKYVFP